MRHFTFYIIRANSYNFSSQLQFSTPKISTCPLILIGPSSPKIGTCSRHLRGRCGVLSRFFLGVVKHFRSLWASTDIRGRGSDNSRQNRRVEIWSWDGISLIIIRICTDDIKHHQLWASGYPSSEGVRQCSRAFWKAERLHFRSRYFLSMSETFLNTYWRNGHNQIGNLFNYDISPIWICLTIMIYLFDAPLDIRDKKQ